MPRLRTIQPGNLALRAAPQRKAATVRLMLQRVMLAPPPVSQWRLCGFLQIKRAGLTERD